MTNDDVIVALDLSLLLVFGLFLFGTDVFFDEAFEFCILHHLVVGTILGIATVRERERDTERQRKEGQREIRGIKRSQRVTAAICPSFISRTSSH